jgi:hypothetical protein
MFGDPSTTARLIAWRKQIGDMIHVSDTLCDIETESAVFSYSTQAGEEGELVEILVHEGQDQVTSGHVRVKTVLLIALIFMSLNELILAGVMMIRQPIAKLRKVKASEHSTPVESHTDAALPPPHEVNQTTPSSSTQEAAPDQPKL